LEVKVEVKIQMSSPGPAQRKKTAVFFCIGKGGPMPSLPKGAVSLAVYPTVLPNIVLYLSRAVLNCQRSRNLKPTPQGPIYSMFKVSNAFSPINLAGAKYFSPKSKSTRVTLHRSHKGPTRGGGSSFPSASVAVQAPFND